MSNTPKPIRRKLRRLFREKRGMLPTAKERGDGKNPLQILRKYFKQSRSAKSLYSLKRTI